jgi:ABC-type transporter Mla subunit MlaD
VVRILRRAATKFDINVHVHPASSEAITTLLVLSERILKGINHMTQQIDDLTARVEVLATRAEKVAAEVLAATNAAAAEIQALKDQIAQGQNPDFTALEAALARAEAAVGATDDVNPDA